MEQLLQQIESYKQEIVAANGIDAETFRIKWLGTKGLVKTIMCEMKNVAPENKKEAGQLLNEFKLFTEAKYEELKSLTTNDQRPATNEIDPLKLTDSEHLLIFFQA